MQDAKSFLRHEILNLITQLHFLVDDLEIPEEKARPLNQRLNLLAFLSAEEGAILSGKKDFYQEKVDGRELLFLVRDIVGAKPSELSIPEFSMELKADFECLKHGLNAIVSHLMSRSIAMHCDFDSKNNSLFIAYKGDASFSLDDVGLLEELKREKEIETYLLKAYLKLMQMSGVDLKMEPGKITLCFKSA